MTTSSSTRAPGRLDSSTSNPYTSDTATPSALDRPTSGQTRAAAPSRHPQPARLNGITMASNSKGASASRVLVGVAIPMARAAQTITRP